MADNDSHERTADGGTVSAAAQEHRQTDYLEQEVNILRPSSRFMRDHLKVVWGTFLAWVLVVWGPVTMTYLAPDLMTTTIPVLQFPAHYFLVAFGGPTGALILAAVYARQRDRLDRKYDIDPASVMEETESTSSPDATATDGGADQ
jgi:putative solute:sodium symporter small subunit